jgi:hypothetical protein
MLGVQRDRYCAGQTVGALGRQDLSASLQRMRRQRKGAADIKRDALETRRFVSADRPAPGQPANPGLTSGLPRVGEGLCGYALCEAPEYSTDEIADARPVAPACIAPSLDKLGSHGSC